MDINQKSNMKVVILNITEYKEKDAIITALNESEVISFTAKGIFSERSQNKILNVPLNIVDIEIEKGKLKYPILKSFNMIYCPLISDVSIEYMTSLNIITEATKKLLTDEDKHYMFNTLVDVITNLKSAKNYYALVLYYLDRLFSVAGYGFEVNGCVVCGSKKGIAAFSFADGGFICKDCLENNITQQLSASEMALLRNIYNSKDSATLEKIEFNSNEVEHLLKLYFSFIYDNFNITLNSFKTF